MNRHAVAVDTVATTAAYNLELQLRSRHCQIAPREDQNNRRPHRFDVNVDGDARRIGVCGVGVCRRRGSPALALSAVAASRDGEGEGDRGGYVGARVERRR